MATKLRSVLVRHPSTIEQHDVFAAFLRAARHSWGEHMPLEPARYALGVLTVRCSSPLWRIELLHHAEDVKRKLVQEIPQLHLRWISAVL